MVPSLVARSVSHGSLALQDNHCPPARGWMGVKGFGRPEGRTQPQRKGFQPVAAHLKVSVWDFGLGVLMLPGAAPTQGSVKKKKKETKKEKELGLAVSIFS